MPGPPGCPGAPRKDEDSAWKHLLQIRFRQFLTFYFPLQARKVDWSAKPVFLDKELRRILPRSQGKKHIVDTLARVRLRSGKLSWILVHVEIQGRKTRDFAERTYVCRYRIFDRYRRRVASLAVYTGKGRVPVGRYDEKGMGDRLTLRFPVASLESFRTRWKELERSRNPFALVTLAHLSLPAARTPGKRLPWKERLRWKERLAERLYERGYGQDDIIELYRFLDWLVVLPPRLQEEYERHVDQLELRDAMPFLSLREERAIRKGLAQGLEKGLEQGLEKGLREAIEQGLERRFGEKGRKLVSRLEKLQGADALRRVLEAVFAAEGLEEIRRLLPAK